MRNMLLKEFKLAMHPTAIIFLSLSAMLLIPNYPYYVTFFYTGLAVFFTCLNGRENYDILYSMSLPVRKKDIVKSRFIFVIILQLSQVIVAIPFAIIRQKLPVPSNQVGMEANIAFFGLAFVMLGIFNLVFFVVYYKDVNKVGAAFLLSSIAVFAYMLVAEACTHVLPFAKNCLDTKDPYYLKEKLIVMAIGILIYSIATILAYIKSVKSFEALDI